MIRITQLSDLHFSTTAERSHGGFGYDTDETYLAVIDHAFAEGRERPDAVVITGDIADNGLPDEYSKAARALEQIPIPIYTWPGNHDRHVDFESRLPRPGLTMQRTLRLGPWLFVFADSNFDGRDLDEHGRLHDRDGRMHEANGSLGGVEATWMADVIDASDAEHVFIWVHHPPDMPGTFAQPDYDAEMAALLSDRPQVRGIGAGHVHTDRIATIADRPVYVCPALTINVDLDAFTLLPPGYRTYTFADDGTVTSDCHLLDDERWPRFALPRWGVDYLTGAISWEEMLNQRE